MLEQPQLKSNIKIDYSKVSENNVFPFAVELNLEDSILTPDSGQNQRFSYIVTGKSGDASSDSDLEHLVLGVCDSLVESQITNVSVWIDGVKQSVVLGENVKLITPEKVSPPIDCTGLKFDFNLKNAEGVMTVSFELAKPYPVGPNPVFLFGGNAVATGLTIAGPSSEKALPYTCHRMAYQKARVCVPITVTPFARMHAPTTYCCGDPVILPADLNCPGCLNGSCTFTLRQKICVEIPIELDATATTSGTYVCCNGASAENICRGCSCASEDAEADFPEESAENMKSIDKINSNLKKLKSFFS